MTPSTMEVVVRFAVFQLDLCKDCNEDTIYLVFYITAFSTNTLSIPLKHRHNCKS